MYARIECEGTRIKVQVGSAEGGSDIVNWDFTDSTFASKGCFWLMNYQMMDLRFDYFNYSPPSTGMQGVVRDSLGNTIAGAAVSTSTGGYSTTSGAGGVYSITGMDPATYSATASKANYNSQTVDDIIVSTGSMTTVDFTITDATPPTTPVVTDDGAYQTSSDSVRFSWSSSDPESGVEGYRYAVSKTTSMLDIIPGGDWLEVGTSTTHTRTGLSLANGQTYYGLVRARNPLLAVSEIGVSDGIKVAKAVPSIAQAKAEPDGTMVALEGRPVTASFTDCIYVEDPDRTSGIKVDATGIAEGALVDLVGYLSMVDGERRISGYSVTVVGAGQPPEALALGNAVLGGGSLDPYTPGVTGGVGLHNIGLLVATWGKVESAGSGYFVIEDGSGAGLQVAAPAGVSLPSPAQYVVVTGISSCESSGPQIIRLLRVRSQADIHVVQ